MKDNTLLVIGALGIGAFVLYNWFKTNPLVQGATGVIDTITKTIKKTNTPVVNTPPGTAAAPTPFNFSVPWTGIPGFFDFIKQPLGVSGTVGTTGAAKTVAASTPSTAAMLFPPLGVIEAVRKIPALLGETSKYLNPPEIKPAVVSARTGNKVTSTNINWTTQKQVAPNVRTALGILQTNALNSKSKAIMNKLNAMR
jgi:hypothetical protein